MRIISTDLREGRVRVRVETLDDLWHLEKVLEKGDLVTARTFRKTAVKRGSEIETGDRRPVVLTLELEKVQMEQGILRLTGPIREGPEDVQLASYHSIIVEPGLVLTVRKSQWRNHQLDRLKKATIRKPLLLICAMDREQADFAALKDAGIEWLGSVSARKVKDREERDDFYIEILEKLGASGPERFGKIIIAGPGFERENLLNFAKKRRSPLADRMILEQASCAGRAGVQEVIKSSADRVLRDTRIAHETGLVEGLLEGMKRDDGMVSYGRAEVMKAAAAGAVEALLVSEEKVREFEGLMDHVEKQRGEVHIISSEHESGEKLLHLGGIAAFLRFRVEF